MGKKLAAKKCMCACCVKTRKERKLNARKYYAKVKAAQYSQYEGMVVTQK